jgi:glyoxylase-like metal-dependent hydrolase (beta-lactamase superfamily II)
MKTKSRVEQPLPNIITITYDSTNYYLVQAACGWIMIDTGWPGTLAEYLSLLKKKNIDIREVKYLIVTHFHPDHAGLVQEIKDFGAKLIVHESQISFIENLKSFFIRKPQYNFKDIDTRDNIIVTSKKSRDLLLKNGVKGEIITTLGHSEDSISFIIDGCCAFTGDLPGMLFADLESNPGIKESWMKIAAFKVKKIYPGHGYSFEM